MGDDRFEGTRETLTERSPLRGVATPETCADAILGFIQTNTFVTGQTIVVDGGMSL